MLNCVCTLYRIHTYIKSCITKGISSSALTQYVLNFTLKTNRIYTLPTQIIHISSKSHLLTFFQSQNTLLYVHTQTHFVFLIRGL